METSDLLDSLEAAVERRRHIGWPQADQALAALDRVRADPAPDGEVARVAERFGLSADERSVLAVTAAAEATTALHLLLGLLSGDDRPARPTVALVLELAGLPATGTAAEALLGGPGRLVRLGLVAAPGEEVLLARRPVVAARVAAAINGSDQVPPPVEAMLVETVPLEVDGHRLLARALAEDHGFAWVTAPTGSAALPLAAAACAAVGAPWLAADLALRPAGWTSDDAARALLLEAGLAGAVLVLVGAEQVSQPVLDESAVPVIAVSPEPWDASRAQALPVAVPAPRLSLQQREQLWRLSLDATEVTPEIAALRLSPEQILAVGHHAREEARLHGEAGVGADRIRESARLLSKGRSGRQTTGAVLADLVLPPRPLAEVRRLLAWARHRDEVVSRGPLHGKGGKGTGITALFSGPPGTGKTLAAHVIAEELGMELFQVELSTVVDKYIGETEKNLEKVFTTAESMNAVLFFDEADALFGSRSEVRDARDRYANQEVAYLLQRMEQFDGIAILATNLRGNLDPAFARRLHFMISFPDPDEATRLQLWGEHLAVAGGTDPDDPVDVATIARVTDLAGGAIRNVVLAATYDAVAAGEPVGMRHVAPAIHREYVKLGRRVPAEFSGETPGGVPILPEPVDTPLV